MSRKALGPLGSRRARRVNRADGRRFRHDSGPRLLHLLCPALPSCPVCSALLLFRVQYYPLPHVYSAPTLLYYICTQKVHFDFDGTLLRSYCTVLYFYIERAPNVLSKVVHRFSRSVQSSLRMRTYAKGITLGVLYSAVQYCIGQSCTVEALLQKQHTHSTVQHA